MPYNPRKHLEQKDIEEAEKIIRQTPEPKDYNIDEILIDLAHKSNHLSERYEFEESILHKGTHLSNAKDQLYQLILEVIGEDEFGGNPRWCTYRNELRQEQRQNLNNLFGKETK